MGRTTFGEIVESELRAERAAEEVYEERVRCNNCGRVETREISFDDGEAIEPCGEDIPGLGECLSVSVERAA